MTIGKRIKQLREDKGLTQEDIAKKIGVAIQTIYKYENEIVTNIPLDKLEKIAKALQTTPAYLMGWEKDAAPTPDPFSFSNIQPIKKHRIPLLGEIACGEPIFADEDFEGFIESDIEADFALRCNGDSMTGARIMDGDIVLIKKQDMVENGQIAAVIIENEATLKRVMYFKEKNTLILKPENPRYEDLIYTNDELNQIRILGKAVAFYSKVR